MTTKFKYKVRIHNAGKLKEIRRVFDTRKDAHEYMKWLGAGKAKYVIIPTI